MLLRKINPMRLVAVGMLVVTAGALSLHHHVPGLSPDLSDALTGFLYGAGLSLMILGVIAGRRSRRGPRGSDGRPLA